MERLIKKIKIGPLVLELCGLEYCAWYPSPSSSGTILYWPLILYEHHSLLSQFSETQLTHIPTATLSSLTFSIFLSLFQSPSQLSLTFSISVSNSPTRSQSPFQSRSRSHSPSPSHSWSPSCSVTQSPFRSVAWSPSRSVAHALGLPLTRYVSLSLHLQFEHWVFVGICGEVGRP